ncbi:MAG: DUF4845 domain-containing protein [Pseudomonadota bacterium]
MISQKNQHGLTMISWLLVLTMVGFFIMVGMKLAPVYLQHYTIMNILESVQKESLISRKPVAEIRTMISRRLNINSVDKLKRENIKIRRSSGITTIEVNYEERRPIVGNLDAIMTFNESVELVAN